MPYLGNPAQQRFSSPRAASVYSGDGSTTAFTLEEVVTTDEDILVSVDGVIQEPSVAYAVSSGTTLTFTAAPSTNSGNNIFVYYIARTFGSVSMPDGQNVNAATLNTSGNVVFNEASASVDFRVESNGNANMLVVDGSADKVGIGTASPGAGLTLEGTKDNLASQLKVTASGVVSQYMGGGDAVGLAIGHDHASLPIEFKTGVTSGTGVAGSGTTQMKIDGTGAITMPNQPAFLVNPSSDQTNIAINSNVTVVFGTERFDNNSDFASNTFTAPVTGKYQMNVTIYFQQVDSAAAYMQLKLVTSNVTYQFVFDPDFGQDAVYWTTQISQLVDMDASDTAFVQVTQSGGSAQADIVTVSYFSGYLVA